MFIAHIESSLNWGGQELRVIEQIEWLINNGHKSIIIARQNSAIISEAKRRGLPYYELEIRGSVNIRQINKLIKFLKINKVDVLDAHSNRDASYAMFVKLFTNIKVVRSRHVTNKIKIDFFRKLVWKYGNHSIIVTANKIKQDIAVLNLAKEAKIFVAPAGVDEKRFDYALDNRLLKKSLGIADSDKVIANIGMIRPDKGQIFFLKMAEILLNKYDDLTFLQIGDYTKDTQYYKKDIDSYCNKLASKKIKFIGYKHDIENYISVADIIVISSIKTEAQTRLVSQAYLMKKNIVATNVGGLPEMIDDNETGLLCKPENALDLAEKVSMLLENAQLRKRLSDRAYQYGKSNSTMAYMMNYMLNIYKTLMVSS